MVAEPWILKMGNQVSNNLKHALLLEPSSKRNKNPEPKRCIGILSFEVANTMSKTIHLHKSLTDSEISKLKDEILNSEGIKLLVSDDQSYLLQLVLAEKLDDLNRVGNVVSRLGKKCSEPALRGFEHVYNDVVSGVIDVKELGFLVKDMDSMVRKMERFVNATSNLYTEMEVLNELEQTSKKFQQNQHEESRRAFEQKLIWQKQDVRHLKEISLWNQTYDKVVELLARTVCTIYAKICVAFGDSALRRDNPEAHSSVLLKDDCRQVSGHVQTVSGPFKRVQIPEGFSWSVLALSSSVSKFDADDEIDREEGSSQISGCCTVGNGGYKRDHPSYSGYFSQTQSLGGEMNSAQFGPKSRLTGYASPSTVGGSALALHYANVIIVIEKLLRYPHLVGEEAREDLYQMLPASLRLSLKTNLKSYVKNLAIYDAPLAHDWKETLDGILKWLAPMAHNMIRWQSERNFEQQQIVTRTNVLLLQTLYFADREKTEAAICELLVGLNYICRYEHQQNALLDCASSFDIEDCVEWQLQYGASYIN
ncbi:hypothetical protein CISIN_1g047107mg [Citrus sinensis]|uniref:DUF668 domain-containing protein n=1 Tax=Citrus sinensis TaxID=2711 RepID=A0A067DIT3_CITSI|nr:hypothetical protein CISIN_1g047107mg [Citrus sinensis]